MQEGNHKIFNFFENGKNAYFFVKDFLFRGKSGIINRKAVHYDFACASWYIRKKTMKQ